MDYLFIQHLSRIPRGLATGMNGVDIYPYRRVKIPRGEGAGFI